MICISSLFAGPDTEIVKVQPTIYATLIALFIMGSSAPAMYRIFVFILGLY